MPRVTTVKKARKDYPGTDIKKGDTYYWWSFRYGGIHMSKTYPKQSQLTQSDFLQRVYEFNEQLEEVSWDIDSASDERDQIVSGLGELRDECEEKRDAMPEQLQDVGSGELLQERYDALDGMINELESIDFDFDEIEVVEDPGENASAFEIDTYDEYQTAVQERNDEFESRLEEVRNISYDGG